MTNVKDTDPSSPDDVEIAMLMNVMKATGLPRETLEGFLMTDGDLDSLCDSVLSELAVPPKKGSAPKT